MRSFTLSALASLALGVFCSAAPTPGAGLPSIAVAARDAPVPAEQNETVQSILTGTADAVGPLVDQVGERIPTRSTSSLTVLV
jgi:hypothetical protein